MEVRSGRQPTIADVARLAGVPTATVSHVLRGRNPERVPEQIRERVYAAVRRLGYGDRRVGRSPSPERTDLVVMHAWTQGMLRSGLIAAELARLGSKLREAGYTFMLHDEPDLQGLRAARVWAQLRPAAVIAETAQFTSAAVETLQAAGTVPIGIGREPSPLVPTLVLDDSSLGEAAATHLLAQGRINLAVLLPRAPGARVYAEARYRGAERVATRHGARIRRVTMAESADDAAALVREWTKGDHPDGVFAWHDGYAGLLLGALLDAGLRVPDDIALVGAGNDAVCEMLRPRLTSVGAVPSPPGAAPAVLAALEDRWDPDRAVVSFTPRLHRRDT
ncbi:LacI family DNA-binding transcriptional regulator [Thermomonospora catenispora]|uniref:LacI family DNA-binding transcriptional regulator n=1 Tax=Thermomonospora catenispora TaxID=2493090 RepID=UPI001122505B|nr:LacI family DNA-binding transcriptional regulator [Thermomonospora catenispora]TNY35907.1 LacI family transcriptional regulator [Thermomonospora catenispora]